MNGLAIMLVSATLGVDYGWQATNDGQLEYLIQIEPALVRSLENGESIVSELPPEVRSVRRFRISVGRQALPRDAIKQTSAELPADRARGTAPSDLNGSGANAAKSAGQSKQPNLTAPDNAAPTNAAKADAARDGQTSAKAAGAGDVGSTGRVEQPVRRPTWSDYDPDKDTNSPRSREYGDNRSEPGRFRQTAADGNSTDRQGSRASFAGANSPSDDRTPRDGDRPTVENASTADATATKSHDTTQSWLMASLVALFGSLGANFYQGWNLASARRRYHQLVDRLGLRGSAAGLSVDGITVESYGQ